MLVGYAVALLLGFTLVAVSWGTTRLWAKTLVKLAGALALCYACYSSYVAGFSPLLGLVGGLATLCAGVPVSLHTVARRGGGYLEVLLDLLVALVACIYSSPSLGLLITFWIAAEVVAFALISFDYWSRRVPEALRAGYRFILVSMLCFDLSAFVLAYAIYVQVGDPFTLLLELFYEPVTVGFSYASSLGPFLTLVAYLGFMAKAGLVPLHFWVPEAYTRAPAPAAAILAGLFEPVGVYGAYLLALAGCGGWLVAYVLVALAGASIVYGMLVAVSSTDLRRMLSYTSIACMGFCFLVVTVYAVSASLLALAALAALLLYNASHKTMLMLDTGCVEDALGSRELPRVEGGMGRGTHYVLVLLGILSLLGVPGTAGFIAKLLAFAAIASAPIQPQLQVLLLALAAVYAGLAGVVAMRYARVYGGEAAVAPPGLAGEAAVSSSNIVFAFPPLLYIFPAPLALVLAVPMSLVVLAVALTAGTGGVSRG